MQRLFTIPILIAALALSGCATTSSLLNKTYISDPEHSYAWNVAQAAGLDVEDIPWEEVQKAREEALAKGAPVDNGPSALGAASYGVVHGLNMGSFLSGGIGALAWMSVGNKRDPRAMSKILVWMPMEMATGPEDASAKIEAMVRNAYEKALAETGFPSGYVVSTEEKTVIVNDRFKRSGYFVSGNECDNKKIDARYKQIQLPRIAKSFRLEAVKVLPEAGKSPDFVSAREAWTYSLPIFGRTFVDLGSSPPEVLAKFPDLEVFRRTSENLPNWICLYLSPASQISMSDGDGSFKFLKYPLVLNRGKVHFFVEPPPKNL